MSPLDAKDPARAYHVSNPAGETVKFSHWFATLDDARKWVKAHGRPVRVYDRQTDQGGKLWPSGSVRFNP